MSSSNLIPFAFEDALVRIHTDDKGDPWFVAKDVCRVLEIGKYRDALGTLDDDEKGCPVMVDTLGGKQEMATVSESGLYALVFRSRKPAARRFRKWVTSEVLPAIRRTGYYQAGGPGLIGAAPLPELPPIPEEALSIRPALRERLWQDALQTARLDNAGSDVAMHWFRHLCRMMVQKPVSVVEEVREFLADWCEFVPGGREKASVLYEAFLSWRGDRSTPSPSMKVFGQTMSMFVRAKKSNGIMYCGICLAQLPRRRHG